MKPERISVCIRSLLSPFSETIPTVPSFVFSGFIVSLGSLFRFLLTTYTSPIRGTSSQQPIPTNPPQPSP